MRLIACTAVLLVAMFMVFLTADAIRGKSARSRAKGVRIGDSKQQVRESMGRPSHITGAGLFLPETWAYGSYLNWNYLPPNPVRFRIFGPDADEVVIRFDGAGKVSRVTIPKPDQK